MPIKAEDMAALVIRLFKTSLANQGVASLGLYGCMAIYVLLWIFTDYQAYLLCIGFVLKAITIPYFLRIGEPAVAQEAAFLMVADVVGITLNLGSALAAANQCRRLFGL